ncbi:MAG: esterase-like activity of phytase family protein [Myxococcales bacterium FL481]|nr:MAG: esterase-like activity of phytase family protein [Myxococcales bacterium FL481]
MSPAGRSRRHDPDVARAPLYSFVGPTALYEIDVARADNVLHVDALSGHERPVAKRLVLNFDDVRRAGHVERVGSFEAMIFGPKLEDGRHSLLFVEDNDGAVATQVVAFAVAPHRCDADFDGNITRSDLELIRRSLGKRVGRYDARDKNHNRRVDWHELRGCAARAKR